MSRNSLPNYAAAVCRLLNATAHVHPDCSTDPTPEFHMSNRKGFTLIELLIVVVIIGILAAIAIPKFSSVKQKGYRTPAIAELQALKTAEEPFFVDSNRYGQITELSSYSRTSSVGSPSLTPSTSYWLATVTHPQIIGMSCGISVRQANPVNAGAGEGEHRGDKESS